jgi:predicted RNA binding protein YcfA (HicA-like mRNA interferase family)
VSSDWKKMIQALRKQGWFVGFKGRGGHITCTPPGSKRSITIPNSAYGYRAIYNARARLRKLARESGIEVEI